MVMVSVLLLLTGVESVQQDKARTLKVSVLMMAMEMAMEMAMAAQEEAAEAVLV
jgi:hypothetical protein